MPVVSALLVELLTRDPPFGLGLDRDTALTILGYSYVQRRLTMRRPRRVLWEFNFDEYRPGWTI